VDPVSRDLTVSDLRAAGVCLRARPMKPRDGWMFEGVVTVARRAIGVAIVRRNSKRNGGKRA
jgi:hypothetical protein